MFHGLSRTTLTTVEPRSNEVPRDWEFNWFSQLRVRYIEARFLYILLVCLV